MERLTEVCWRNLDPWETCGQDDYCKRGCHEAGGCTKGCIVPKTYSRLAEYEDTGLKPLQIQAQSQNLGVAYNIISSQEKEIASLKEALDLSRAEVQGLSRKVAEYQRLEKEGLILKGGTYEFLEDIASLMRIYDMKYFKIVPLSMDAKIELFADKSKKSSMEYYNISTKEPKEEAL